MTSSVFSLDLMLPDDVEEWLVRKKKMESGIETSEDRICTISVTDQDGRLKPKDMIMKEEVSLAMKRIRGYFEGSWKPDGTPEGINIRVGIKPAGDTSKDEYVPKLSKNEYWGMVGDKSPQRLGLYRKLGINRYIGEAALSELYSHNMLTDTSSDDIFSMLNDSSLKRPGKWGINQAYDIFTMCMTQEFQSTHNGKLPTKDEQTLWMSQRMPRHMIRTGLMSGGMEALNRGEWLEWRVNEDMYSSADRRDDMIRDPASVNRPATDPIARLDLYRNGLEVLEKVKKLGDPTTTAKDLEDTMSRVMRWLRADLKAYGYSVDKNPGSGSKEVMINVDFSLADQNGILQRTESFDQGARMMEALAEMFLFSHSIANPENLEGKPMTLDVMASTAASILRVEAQSPEDERKATFIPFSLDKGDRVVRQKYLRFVDRLYNDCYAVVETTRLGGKMPSWYETKIPFSNDFVVFLYKQLGLKETWNAIRDKIEV